MSAAEPVWITKQDLLAIHEQLLAAHGGSSGVRDEGLLESALARPRNHYAYGETDIHALATAYAEGLTRNHPFVDGNKRSAFMAAFVFLGVNGFDLRADETDVVRMMVGLSERSVPAEAFAGWLRDNTVSAAPGGSRERRRGAKPAVRRKRKSR